MPGKRQPHARRVDVDDPCAGIIDEDGFAEAQPRGHGLAVLPSGHGMAVKNNAELVSVPTAGTAEHPKYMKICHTGCLTQQACLSGHRHRALIGMCVCRPSRHFVTPCSARIPA
ncbi:hypothetical protein GCM10023176_61440 [Micromonospora coerulea]|uniref:Uncharacterized protein n=1 Tax=Micromonospora coerulea TaxID=47856 RepID=A0ABP8T3U5_9ACTN